MNGKPPKARGELAQHLITLRRQRRLSQRALARLAGVSQGTIRDIEMGTQQKPRLDTLRLLARGLATSEDQTIDWSDAQGSYFLLLKAIGEDPMAIMGSLTGLLRQDHEAFKRESSKLLIDLDDEQESRLARMSEVSKLTAALEALVWGNEFPDEDLDMILGVLRALVARYVGDLAVLDARIAEQASAE